MTSTVDSVLYRIEDCICTITMNAPERKNAFDNEMLLELARCFAAAGRDPDVAVVVFTGSGDSFCAGGDVKDMGSHSDPTRRKAAFTDVIHQVPDAIRAVDKPIIAMINGVAVGAGFDMALWCDFRFAAETAKMSEGYVNVGLAAGDGGAYLLPRLIGLGNALDLLLTGRVIRGEEAAAIGLVHRALPAEDLTRYTYEFARELSSKPIQALRMMKRLVYQSMDISAGTAMELASSQVSILMCGSEHLEAVEKLRARR